MSESSGFGSIEAGNFIILCLIKKPETIKEKQATQKFQIYVFLITVFLGIIWLIFFDKSLDNKEINQIVNSRGF